MEQSKRSSFSGSLGFILAAAGSAVGLGNIWRFPYLAAKDNGGLFILIYIILALTFGFTLLTTEIAIGRKTKQSPLTAYKLINKKFGFIGSIATIVPVLILPYYCTIGGWVIKYFITFLTGDGVKAAADGYFTGFISDTISPLALMVVFLLITSIVIIGGVNKGIEKSSKVLMPILLVLVIGISIYSLTLSHTTADGITRTGLDGLKIYLIPSFENITVKDFFITLMDAMGQLFFSISVAMGIMVAYGSYVSDNTNLMKSINQIEIFDTLVALLAGLMIVPAVFVFMGKEGMSAGPGLMFVSLPKVFENMGSIGTVIGILFFLMVLFAAITSSVSIMEAIVSSIIQERKVLLSFLFTLLYSVQLYALATINSTLSSSCLTAPLVKFLMYLIISATIFLCRCLHCLPAFLLAGLPSQKQSLTRLQKTVKNSEENLFIQQQLNS